MKTSAHTLLLAIGLAVGGCAASTSSSHSMSSPNSAGMVARSSGASARREFVASTVDVDREPVGSFRAERGIPTPQPAREPSFVSIPVPQPPLPSPDVHRASHTVSSSSRNSY